MKNIFIVCMFFLFITDVSFASEQVNLKEFVSEIKEYNNEMFPEISDEAWLQELISRKDEFRWTRYYKKNIKYYFK